MSTRTPSRTLEAQAPSSVFRIPPHLLLLACALAACGGEANSVGVNGVALHPEVSAPSSRMLIGPSALDCSKSPLGESLLIGGDLEPYLAYRGAQGAPVTNGLDLSTADGTNLARIWAYSNADGARQNISLQKSVAADLNGDGRTELVTSFMDANRSTQIVSLTNAGSNLPTPYYWSAAGLNNYSATAIAAGNLDRSSNRDDEIAWGFIDSDGMTQIFMLDGSTAGGIGHPDGYVQGWWRRSTAEGRVGVRYLDMATGDLDNDGNNDEIVLAFLDSGMRVQLVVLKFDPGYVEPDKALNYREIASTRIDLLGAATPELKVTVGNTDGDTQNEIVVAIGVKDPDASMATQLQLRTFKLSADKTQLVAGKSWDRHFLFRNLGLGVGDTDLDGMGEIVLAFQGYASTLSADNRAIAIGDGFNAVTLDAEYSTPFIHNSLFSPDNYRSGTSFGQLSLAVGDLDKDGLTDMVVGFRDGSNVLQTIRLEDRKAPDSGGLQVLSAWRDTAATNPSGLSVVLGDWTNDSIKGHYEPITGATLRCERIVEPQVSSAVFVPPYWKNINPQSSSGSVGESLTVGKSQETSLTSSTSHTISFYAGAGVDAEAYSVAVKVTAAHEWSVTQTTTGGSGETAELSTAWSNSDDFAIIENHVYDCYTYQLRQGSTPIDSSVRFCVHTASSDQAPMLNTWDVQYSPINNGSSAQWAPVVREWSNLALFRGASTRQSSECWSGSPGRAVDGNTWPYYGGNSVTHTCYENKPWWQVDLGQSQPVGKVLVWNRSKADGCSEGACSTRLKDFYVFVSDTDFSTISNDPDVLKNDPRVKAYYHPGVAGEVTNILTLPGGNPTNGRFVRVQLTGASYLSLAEVQVFGTNHVEPYRYPTAVRDTVPNDGSFEAEVYDPVSGTYKWITLKGNLLWDGATRNVLGNKAIGPGGGIASWSLTQERSGWLTDAASVSSTWSAGIAMEGSLGKLYKLYAGLAYETSWAVTREVAHTLSWGKGFELGGSVGGFPSTVNGQIVLWDDQCQYQIRPYYYEVTQRSDAGYPHRFLVVDYTVPKFLDRTANLESCRQGTYRLPASLMASEGRLEPELQAAQ